MKSITLKRSKLINYHFNGRSEPVLLSTRSGFDVKILAVDSPQERAALAVALIDTLPTPLWIVTGSKQAVSQEAMMDQLSAIAEGFGEESDRATDVCQEIPEDFTDA